MKLRNLFLACRDLARSRCLYADLLRLPLKRQSARSLVFDLVGCELHLHGPLTEAEIATFGVYTDRGSANLVVCLEVCALDALCEHLQGAGYPLRMPPQSSPWGTRMAMLDDPDGLRLELSEVPSKELPETEPSEGVESREP